MLKKNSKKARFSLIDVVKLSQKLAQLTKQAVVPLLLIGFFFILFSFDFALKAFALEALDEPILFFRIPSLGVQFSLERVLNQGAMWGAFSSYAAPLFYFRLLIITLLMVVVFFFTKRKTTRSLLTLILTGAIGNIVDTLTYGHVVDMLHFTFSGKSYGIFNLADLYISMGCIGLIAMSFMKREEKSDATSL